MKEHDRLFSLYKDALKRNLEAELRDELRREVREEVLREVGDPYRDALENRFLTHNEVLALIGESKSTFAVLRRDPKQGFPKPVGDGAKHPKWFLREVEAWRATRPRLSY